MIDEKIIKKYTAENKYKISLPTYQSVVKDFLTWANNEVVPKSFSWSINFNNDFLQKDILTEEEFNGLLKFANNQRDG